MAGGGPSGASCVGGTMGGAVTELMSLGAADIYLTLNANVTHWRSRYNKHTNFAMEALEQPFQSQVAFGSDVQVTLNRTGDLIYYMYVVIDLPGISACAAKAGVSAVCGGGNSPFPSVPASATGAPGDPCDPCGDGFYENPSGCGGPSGNGDACGVEAVDPAESEPWAHYTNAIGQFLVRRACLVIGGQVVDTLYNDYLFMWEELSGKPGKRLLEMIGKREDRQQLIQDSAESRRLYVPLPYWFTYHSGNALPLVSLQFHGVQVHVQFAQLSECIQVSDPSVTVVKSADCQPLTANDLSARLDTTYVYLDIEERDRFATGSFEQLVHQVQQFQMSSSSCQVRMNLNFNHPIIELMWAVRRSCQQRLNNWFNYSGKWGRDPIGYVHLRLNNLPRFSGREGRYFRLVQPYQHHTNIPDSYVYSFSFALHAEGFNPSGSCNFSRIDNVELIFDMQEELTNNETGRTETVVIIVFARNWNIFRYREGLGGLAFSNACALTEAFEGEVSAF